MRFVCRELLQHKDGIETYLVSGFHARYYALDVCAHQSQGRGGIDVSERDISGLGI